jgi:hypothetical protein
MWGGMFTKAKEGVVEEDYYLAEWTPEERAQVCVHVLSVCAAHRMLQRAVRHRGVHTSNTMTRQCPARLPLLPTTTTGPAQREP